MLLADIQAWLSRSGVPGAFVRKAEEVIEFPYVVLHFFGKKTIGDQKAPLVTGHSEEAPCHLHAPAAHLFFLRYFSSAGSIPES